MTKSVNIRELIVDMLLEITRDKAYSHVVISNTLEKYQYLSKQERSFLKRVTNGTMEHMIYIDYILNHYSKIKISKCKPLIRCILRSSVYQLYFMDSVPASAVCNEAVKLAGKRGFQNLKGFVNGVLRSIVREDCPNLLPPKDNQAEYLSVKYSMPQWLVQEWLTAYGRESTELSLAYFQKEPSLTIRCNNFKTNGIELKEWLKRDGVLEIEDTPLVSAFAIGGFDYLGGLSSFQQGAFAIQDISSMLVVEAAGIRENDTVIDVCAAPGGKTMHAADKLMGTGQVICGDVSGHKAEKILENAQRMGYQNISVNVWDARVQEEELMERAEVVIADVPCSGLGVIGRKPDIKYRITKETIAELLPLQREILHTAQSYVKPEGVLMFSTCTVGTAENQENVQWFLAEHPDFTLEDFTDLLPREFTEQEQGQMQLLPGKHNTDGFFIAKLRRKKNG
ncbi:MAG: 16S rRNA (cytosine(967)-C(5))-methyltransferase RsmB [Lachnospiraceae bacterium]|nr:16S rRNA (cytosine(967)-C(5))-methyltransferase RsmB [Lachnospiraceae bacterium]